MRESKLDPHAGAIAEALDDGVSQRDLAKRYGVSRSTLQNWIKTRTSIVPEAARWHAGDDLSEDPEDSYTEIPVIVRDYSHLKELYVYPLGDVHKGSSAHAGKRWQQWLDYLVTTPNTSMLGTGDFFNAALKDSKSESYDEVMTVKQAREELSDDMKPLADQGRVDLLIPGNHEARIYRACGDDPVSAIARELDIPYVAEAAVVLYIVGDVAYEVFVRHGTGGGQVGARANRLAQQARSIICDVYVSGHTHSSLAFPQDVFVVNRRLARVERKRQLFVSSGSFVQYEGYAAKAGYAPQKIGAPRIRLDGIKRDPHVSI